MLSSRLALIAARRSPRMLVHSVRSSSHHPNPADIEKIPEWYRNITWDDVAKPQGSWQARYDELQRKSNAFLGISVLVCIFTCWGIYQTHEWLGIPDEPAERWYPEDRFKAGTGTVL